MTHADLQQSLCAWFLFQYLNSLFFIFTHVPAAKPQPIILEGRSPSGSINKSDPPTGSPEKSPPRGETKPDRAPRLRATSSSSSSGGPVSPKPPVPQGTKPALAARPTILQKPRTSSTSKSLGTRLGSDYHTERIVAAVIPFLIFLWEETIFVISWHYFLSDRWELRFPKHCWRIS